MHDIFLLPELLIHILSFLPPPDLHTYTSVSRHWKETLHRNLPLRLLPLPDNPSPKPVVTTRPRKLAKLPQPVSSLAQDILDQTTQWLKHSLLLEVSDDYYFWHEAAYGNLSSALVPFLHPWLGKHWCEFVGGLEETARGEMGICFRTKMSGGEFDRWFARDGEETEKGGSSMGAYLTRPVTQTVEIYCVEGAVWDREYGNVLRARGRREWQQRCVRVERERGVRMGDVVEELRGVLRSSEAGTRDGENLRGDVLLEWRLDDAAKRLSAFEWLDSTG